MFWCLPVQHKAYTFIQKNWRGTIGKIVFLQASVANGGVFDALYCYCKAQIVLGLLCQLVSLWILKSEMSHAEKWLCKPCCSTATRDWWYQEWERDIQALPCCIKHQRTDNAERKRRPKLYKLYFITLSIDELHWRNINPIILQHPGTDTAEREKMLPNFCWRPHHRGTNNLETEKKRIP